VIHASDQCAVLEALLSRPVYYQLAEIAEPAPDVHDPAVAASVTMATRFTVPAAGSPATV